MLLWANTQTNKIEIVKENLNLKELIIDATGAYLPGAEAKNISFEISVGDNLILYADRIAIKTVIGNLFNNAIKFTPQGGNIKITAEQTDNNIKISITDNGVGIPPEILSKLFIFEESISTLGTENEKGTGLGLIICNELIEKHNGSIWIESELGHGTSFYFNLPIVDNKDSQHAKRNT